MHVLSHRWFSQWGVKMESDQKQRVQKRELIGERLKCEMCPMEGGKECDHHQGNTMCTGN